MNVLFLSQIVPYPPHGGVLQRGFNIVKEMSRHNNLHLLAFVHPEVLKNKDEVEKSRIILEDYCNSVEYFTLWPKKSNAHKMAALMIALLYPRPFSTLAHWSPGLARRMKEIVKEQKIDIIHYDTIGLAQYAREFRHIPSALTHHNIESQLMYRRAKAERGFASRAYAALQAKRLSQYENTRSPNFDINIMVSKNDEAYLRKVVGTVRTAVVPNGVDIEYFKPSFESHENIVIYTGGLNMFANIDAVLHFLENIWPKVRKDVPDARFFVIGQDPPAILKEIEKKDPSIVVTGYVDDVRPFVSRASVYVVPIRVGGGTRLKILDAMAQGKSIVSTSIGCEGIDVTDQKNILVARSDLDFAEKIIHLFHSPDERQRLGRAARALVESKYTWSVAAEELQKAYELVTK